MQSRCGYLGCGLRRKMAKRHDHEGIPEMNARPNIVLIHGAWADGSCWSGVIERLQADGYHVTAPQFPLTALADDVARLRQVLDLQDGPTVVAGHSYGGQVMTALGADAPNVVGLVYIAAFGLDQGESLGGLLSQGPVTPALAHLFTDKQGFGWLSEDDFVNHFAADVDPVKARVMYAVQQPLAMSAFGDVMGVPAWKSLPSWYLVATDDEALPPAAERQFAARMGATVLRSRPATSRWSPTLVTWPSSSRRRPKPCGLRARLLRHRHDKSVNLKMRNERPARSRGLSALVTGSTSGIGRQQLKSSPGRGAEIVVHGRDVDRGPAVVDDHRCGRR